ncbi:MAG TPA: DMT family transporter [Clostridia bacterium]|nr:DMT family transporter [Clostridia bacterium]
MKYKGEIALLGVTLFWGFGYSITEYALNMGVSSLQIQALRFLIGFLCLLPLSLKRRGDLTRQTVKKGIILGLLMFSFFYLIHEGQRLTNTSKTAFLVGSYVLFVPAFDWIYNKKIPEGRTFVAAVLSLFGIYLISSGNFGNLTRGDYLLLGGALLVALHMVLSAEYVKDERPIHLNFVQIGVTALFSLIGALLFKSFAPIEAKPLLAIIYIGVVSTFIAYMLQTTGQKYTTATRASILLSLEAPVGTFFGIIIHKDPINFSMSMGYLCIFIAILVSEGIFMKLFRNWHFRRKLVGQGGKRL